jgi:hypothetical protein
VEVRYGRFGSAGRRWSDVEEWSEMRQVQTMIPAYSRPTWRECWSGPCPPRGTAISFCCSSVTTCSV